MLSRISSFALISSSWSFLSLSSAACLYNFLKAFLISFLSSFLPKGRSRELGTLHVVTKSATRLQAAETVTHSGSIFSHVFFEPVGSPETKLNLASAAPLVNICKAGLFPEKRSARGDHDPGCTDQSTSPNLHAHLEILGN